MASAYASRMAIPPEFPQVLKDFAREVLRNYPKDEAPADPEAWILEFGARYFGDASSAVGGGAHPHFLSPEEMEERIRAIFQDADKDGNGVLDRKEFKSVIEAFCNKLDIPLMDTRLLLAEADTDGDGRIDYMEFVPLAVDLLETLQAARRHDEQQEERKEAATQQAEAFLFHGLTKEQLQDTLRDMFTTADKDGSGTLSRTEFEDALRGSSLGLTRREINAILMEADEDHDGQISYSEFEPVCVEVLLEMVAAQFEHARLPREEADMRDFLLAHCQAADPEGTGRLSLEHLHHALRGADLGLTTVQTHALLAEASVDDDGTLEYGPFVDRAASIISAMVAVQLSAEASVALRQYRDSDEMQTLGGLAVGEWIKTLADRLTELEVDTTGAAYTGEVASMLSQEMGFDDGTVRAVLSAAVGAGQAGEGLVELQAVLDFAADIALQRQEQAHLASAV